MALAFFKSPLLLIIASGALLAACKNPQTQKMPDNAIVSTSLCADSYLYALPDIEHRLLALSWQSRSTLSQAPDRLQRLPQADSDPERRLQWRGATLISSAGEGGDVELQWGEDFDIVWSNLEQLASELDTSSSVETLKGRLLSIQRPPTSPRMLYLDRSGATAGPGTFVDTVINAVGGKNIIDYPGWQSPDTETLMGLRPDIILTSFMDSNYAGINDRTSRHSALSTKLKTTPTIDVPGGFWPCAGPGLVDAAEHISQAMSKL